MTNSRVQTLIETIEFTHKLAVYYISSMKEVEPTKVFSSEGKELNSLYWIVGHLAWAENMLILQGSFGTPSKAPILNEFAFGSQHKISEEMSFAELKHLAKKIHEQTIAHLKTLKDEDLAKPNALNFGFGQEPTIQLILMHFIRHLGTHIGHLSWLGKLHGVKTV